MSKDRRKAAIKFKLQRLEDTITKTRKDREGEFSRTSLKIINNSKFLKFPRLLAGLEKLMKTYTANPSFSNQQNREEIELLLDEVNK